MFDLYRFSEKTARRDHGGFSIPGRFSLLDWKYLAHLIVRGGDEEFGRFAGVHGSVCLLKRQLKDIQSSMPAVIVLLCLILYREKISTRQMLGSINRNNLGIRQAFDQYNFKSVFLSQSKQHL
jgi:hypothetical protein